MENRIPEMTETVNGDDPASAAAFFLSSGFSDELYALDTRPVVALDRNENR
jgi:hypothetical protein